MIRTITTTVLLLVLLVTPIFAQSSSADADAITTESLNDEFDTLKASLNEEIPPGIQKAVEYREQLRGTEDIFLLDDANTLIFACVTLEDSLSTLRAQVDLYKEFVKGNTALQAGDAGKEINSRISMPRQFSTPTLHYDSTVSSELDAINGLHRCHQAMRFVLSQMRKKLTKANELLAYQKPE